MPVSPKSSAKAEAKGFEPSPITGDELAETFRAFAHVTHLCRCRTLRFRFRRKA
jgi:hypothetical protein